MSMSYDDGIGTRARRFLSETFGIRGSKNVTAWLLAGAAAYYLFYLPERQRVLEIQVSIGRWQLQLRVFLALSQVAPCYATTPPVTARH